MEWKGTLKFEKRLLKKETRNGNGIPVWNCSSHDCFHIVARSIGISGVNDGTIRFVNVAVARGVYHWVGWAVFRMRAQGMCISIEKSAEF